MPKKTSIAVVLGTRPEIIKLSPLIRLLGRRRRAFSLIHTGQHYSFEMDRVFFRDLELPEPRHQLRRHEDSKGGQGEETARMLAGIERVLDAERPEWVVVQGDTNSVLAGALAAAKIPGVRIAHVEAGLRSYDRLMPEETNRVIADHLSHALFAPTPLSKRILLKEGIAPRLIHVTGNTIVDALRQNRALAKKKVRLDALTGGLKRYDLLTLHRQENVDHRDRLEAILEGLERVQRRDRVPVLFPIHPRTAKRLREFRLELPEGVRAVNPVGFLEFLALEEGARLLLTDSGGVQEEGCILGVPCVTLRTTTERPETLHVGANALAGHDPRAIERLSAAMLRRPRRWKNPFGDGRASERMFAVMMEARR
jgi:UDP-N-acetylglucosamine 2-epimerase (non-hydrolysing)